MILGVVLMLLLGILLVGAITLWPQSNGWGYGPGSIYAVVFFLLFLLLLIAT